MSKIISNQNKLWAFLSLLICFSPCFAQSADELAHYQEKFPTDNLVRLSRELNIEITYENDKIVIVQHSVGEDLFLNKSATQYSKEAVSYSSFFKLENIEASSYNLEDGKYKEYKVKDFRRKNELDGSFYDDVKSVNFIYSNLNAGSKTKLVVEEKVMNPRFLSAFYFGGYFPVMKARLTISVDKNIKLKFKKFNTEGIDLKYSETEKKNKIIYTWESNGVNSIDIEERTPNYKNYYPHIVPIIESYQSDNGEVNQLLSDTSDLYHWYYSLIKNINSDPLDEKLAALVHEITKDKKTELEKVKAIYYWVQNNIKYIAFEYALGGFIPRNANDIYQKKFGDCKDNSSLLHAMLNSIGIESHLTWIGTRKIPYKYTELPTPAVDNHMILAYENKGKTYFLDATGRYIPIDLPTSFIQGKEALISQGEQDFKIEEVPVVQYNDNAEICTSTVYIDNNNLYGSSSNEYTGYRKIDAYNKLENINSGIKLNKFYKDFLQKGNNKFIISNEKETNKFDYDKNFKVSYDFNIADYNVQTSNEIYVNLNLNKVLLAYIIEENRKTDIEVRYKNYYEFNNTLIIPEGYELEYLPENVILENEFISAEINYIKKDNKIIYTHIIKWKYLFLDISDKDVYNDLVKEIKKAYKEITILKKNEL